MEAASLGKEETSAIESTLLAAYSVTKDGVSLLPRLRVLGLQADFLERTEVRHVQALGSYW